MPVFDDHSQVKCIYKPPDAQSENFPVGEAEPVAHSFEFPRLEAERDWLAEPTLLTYPSQTEHRF